MVTAVSVGNRTSKGLSSTYQYTQKSNNTQKTVSPKNFFILHNEYIISCTQEPNIQWQEQHASVGPHRVAGVEGGWAQSRDPRHGAGQGGWSVAQVTLSNNTT